MVLKRLRRGVRNPHLVLRYARQETGKLLYSLGTGSALPPSIIYVVINSTCNLRCKMCDIGSQNAGTHFTKNMGDSRLDMPFEMFKSFIDSVSWFRPEISIGSTEPLLYRDIIAAVAYVKSKGMKCSLGTNGFLLERFAKKLVDAGLDELQVSIDGPPDIHDRIRGVPGTFKRVKDGLSILREYKKKKGVSYPKVFVNTTISEFNHSCLYSTVHMLVDKLKVDNVTLSHLNFVTKDMAEKHNLKRPNYPCTESCLSLLDLKKIDLDTLESQLSKVKARYGYDIVQVLPDMDRDDLKIFYRHPEKVLEGHDRCMVPWLFGQLCANGDVIVLTRCFSFVLGNIDKESFWKIWNGSRMKRLRKDLRENRYFPACTRCCGIF